MFCRAGALFPRKKEKAPDPISYGTEDFRGATHVAGMNRPLLCAVRGAPPGSSPQAPKVEKRFCPAGFHQPPALSEGAAAASFLMAYMGIVYPIPLKIARSRVGTYAANFTKVILPSPSREKSRVTVSWTPSTFTVTFTFSLPEDSSSCRSSSSIFSTRTGTPFTR